MQNFKATWHKPIKFMTIFNPLVKSTIFYHFISILYSTSFTLIIDTGLGQYVKLRSSAFQSYIKQ